MTNLKKKLLPILFSTLLPIILTGCLSKPVKKDFNKKYLEAVKVYDEEIKKDVEGKKENLDYLSQFNALKKYQRKGYLPSNSPFNTLSQEERDLLLDFYGDTLKSSVKETIDRLEWADKIENRVKRAVSYEVTIKGREANGKDEQTTDIIEKKKKEAEEKTKKEFVTKKFGKRWKFSTGVKPNLSSSSLVRAEVYSQLRNFGPKKFNFRKARLSVNTDLEAELGVTKTINNKWYSRVRVGAEANNNGFFDESTLSFVRKSGRSLLSKNPYRQNKWEFYTGYSSKKGVLGVIRFMMRF